MDQIDDILARGVANIIPGKTELLKVLSSDKKLNVYLGIDPTATKIHVGHAVPLRKLQALADLGHHITFLIGDFTALIGDTSDKDSERPILTKEEIEANFQTYKRQAEKVLDFSKVTVRHNSEWLAKLTFEDIVKLSQHFSVGDFTSRELIRRRLDEGKHVRLDEMLYPVMQGYDSYFMDTDLQLGGTDQTFNMQAGRTLQKNLRNKESFVMSNIFLEGTDGEKMSKTGGNAIWLEDTPEDMYAKVMAIHDDFIINYFTLATDTPLREIEEIKKELSSSSNPMSIKKRLALKIVEELHGVEPSKSAEEAFARTVQNKELPQEITGFHITSALTSVGTVSDALVELQLAESRSEAKRLITQGGTVVYGEVVRDPNQAFVPQEDGIIRVGKRKIVKLLKP
ncbi:MAG: tyrosine--tRNA ligase [Patescibacteria group bacterium]